MEAKTQQNNKMQVKELVNKLFELTDFEGFLNCSLESGKITSADIIHMADCYKPLDNADGFDRDRCLETIEGSLDSLVASIPDSISRYAALPTTSEIVDILKKYFDTDDLLDGFSNSDIMFHIEDSWEMDEHDEKIKKECRSDYQEEIDHIEDEERITLLEEWENSSPDELWSLLADYGNCNCYDAKGMHCALSDFMAKLKRSAFNCENIF